jgi:hypothetical protein
MSHDKSKSIITGRAEMGQSKHESNHVRQRYANDPEFRSRILRSNLNSYVKKKHGITLDQYDAQRAAQQGLCACCGKKLSSVRRVHHTADGKFGLLCSGCSKIVASVRHVRRHAKPFEAYLKKCGMTVELRRFYEVMRLWSRTPAQNLATERSS